ncbi:MAG: NAD-binding protein [Sporichthyaceae bacterium]
MTRVVVVGFGPHGLAAAAALSARGARVTVVDPEPGPLAAWPWVIRRVDGWPVVDQSLQVAPGLHVMGPLAELELGPAGRNLWGAQRAATRLVDAICPDGSSGRA